MKLETRYHTLDNQITVFRQECFDLTTSKNKFWRASERRKIRKIGGKSEHKTNVIYMRNAKAKLLQQDISVTPAWVNYHLSEDI